MARSTLLTATPLFTREHPDAALADGPGAESVERLLRAADHDVRSLLDEGGAGTAR
ncbi:MAG: hypothetical protein R2746_00880 [Acidimicrobiales bacterium]